MKARIFSTVIVFLLSQVDCIWWRAPYSPTDKQTDQQKPTNRSQPEQPPLPLIIFNQNQNNNTNEVNVSKEESPILMRCRGRNVDKGRCCSPNTPCVEGAGDCEDDDDCNGDLVCGQNNCKQFGYFFHEEDDCCVKPSSNSPSLVTKLIPIFPLTDPYPGQRCSGRNNQGRRCCTPENPCDEGEGDCDGPGDGGGHDSHAGCKGDLLCGSNNCKKFGSFYHEKDDCCESRLAAQTTRPPTMLYPGSLLEPPPGQRCSGRNYQERRCCSPEEPCGEGEGDCDGPVDGGQHDGQDGCKGDLVCGSNNCRKFGAYFHEKDDCCEIPIKGWNQWEAWSPCSVSCGVGWRRREKHCTGSECKNRQQVQERFCNTQPCDTLE